ncbi:MAG: DUF4835 family protein [Dysgonamonadaceae bacterium]|jgi:hypothetical protein|nr:DUF4835 family protein [Dysgonamonadaceae bacterium]
MIKRLIILFITVFSFMCTIHAQELNAKVTVNSDKIQGTNKNVYTTLQNALTDLINNQKWSTISFLANERIDCSFAITIQTANENNDYFTAELLVQARRPVYNSSYSTLLINFRDVQLDFEYMENSPVEFVATRIDNNLVATIAFYANLILALDFDSFSPNGGSVFYRQAQSIAMQAQGISSWTGWTAFDKPNNRHGIITAYTDEAISAFRDFWYTYHRKGMDEMAANPDRARTTILNALPVLDEIRSARSASVVLQLLADSKLSEIVALSSKATAEEKKTVYDLLRKIYPTMSSQLEPLKK